MEKKSSINDVHKVIQKDLVELYKILNLKLGAANPFAKFSIGGGFYMWSDSRCQWKQMISASSLEQNLVRSALYDTKQRVATLLGEKTAEMLFTIPDDSYIYFVNDTEDIQILVTGWGFKKPVRVAGYGDVDDLHLANPVNVFFLFDGRILENYEFGIRLSKRVKTLRTNSSGFFHFDDIKPGEKFTLVDYPSNRELPLSVVEGQTEYRMDVTIYSNLQISARLDGSPYANVCAKVQYAGKEYDLITGADGTASINLPLYEGESIMVSIDDKSKTELVDKNGNRISFDFESPQVEEPVQDETEKVVPPPTPEPPIDDSDHSDDDKIPEEPDEKIIKVTILDADGNPFKCDKVRFSQPDANRELFGTLDESGCITFKDTEFETNKDLNVEILGAKEKYSDIVFQLEEGESEYVLQELKSKDSPWWKICGEILCAVAIVALSVLLWPAVENVIRMLFYAIY